MNTQRVAEMIIEYFLNHHKYNLDVVAYGFGFYEPGQDLVDPSAESFKSKVYFDLVDMDSDYVFGVEIDGPLNEQTFHNEIVKIERQIKEGLGD